MPESFRIVLEQAEYGTFSTEADKMKDLEAFIKENPDLIIEKEGKRYIKISSGEILYFYYKPHKSNSFIDIGGFYRKLKEYGIADAFAIAIIPTNEDKYNQVKLARLTF